MDKTAVNRWVTPTDRFIFDRMPKISSTKWWSRHAGGDLVEWTISRRVIPGRTGEMQEFYVRVAAPILTNPKFIARKLREARFALSNAN